MPYDNSDPIYNRIVEHISGKSGENDPNKYKNTIYKNI